MKATITLEVLAPTTPEGATIYFTGSLNDWKEGDREFAFQPVEPGRYQLTLEVPKGTVIEYKLNRGNWTNVEVDEQGLEIENRRLAVFGSTTVRHEVPHWRDQASKPSSNRYRETDVRILGPIAMPVLGRDREIAVYLPPNYHKEPTRRFPVLYMWDGQNLFDPSTSFSGEWAVDLTAERLIREGKIEPMIIVGIYNGGSHRLSELSPWRDARLDARGEGHAFMRWVVSDLKDYIDSKFRTLTGPEHTGVAGSSMGGLASLFAAYRYPLVFGRAACLSPAFWFARGQIFRYVASRMRPQGSKIYLDCGERETARVHPKRDFYKVAYAMVDLLKQQGFKEGEDLLWVSDPDGTHSEYFWARRMGPVLEYLFPATGVPFNAKAPSIEEESETAAPTLA
jgi:predicted alpha/beta superfamily hydrolase